MRGSVAVEFALAAGLLVVLLLAYLDLAQVLSARQGLAALVRETARQAAIDGGLSPAAQAMAAQQARLAGLEPGRLELDVRPDRARYGETIRVAARYRHRLRTPALRLLSGDEVPLQAALLVKSERTGWH